MIDYMTARLIREENDERTRAREYEKYAKENGRCGAYRDQMQLAAAECRKRAEEHRLAYETLRRMT